MISLDAQIAAMQREVGRLQARHKWQTANEPERAEHTAGQWAQMSAVLQTLTQLRGLTR